MVQIFGDDKVRSAAQSTNFSIIRKYLVPTIFRFRFLFLKLLRSLSRVCGTFDKVKKSDLYKHRCLTSDCSLLKEVGTALNGYCKFYNVNQHHKHPIHKSSSVDAFSSRTS